MPNTRDAVEVILLQDVDHVGTQGVVVAVRPGFARNYLLPKGLAVAATPQQRKVAEQLARQRQRQVQRQKTQAEELKQRLEGCALSLPLSLGEGGKPFGSVTARDLAEALARQGLEVERHAIQLAQPLKALGSHQIPVRLHPEVTAMLTVSVVNAG